MELLKNIIIHILIIGLSVLALLAIIIGIIFGISVIIEIIKGDKKES